MILPIRCFTCNRVLCDGKVFLFEEHRDDEKRVIQEKLKNLIMYFRLFEKTLDYNPELVFTPSRLNDDKKTEYINELMNNGGNSDEISQSVDFDILNLLSIDKICCRRMFLGYVNMIDKIV